MRRVLSPSSLSLLLLLAGCGSDSEAVAPTAPPSSTGGAAGAGGGNANAGGGAGGASAGTGGANGGSATSGAAGIGGASGAAGINGFAGFAGAPLSLAASKRVTKSCAYTCPMTAGCAEATAPYSCPAVLPWNQIAHDDACPAWNGTYPAVVQGQCTASAPTGDAAAYAGTLPDGTRILPDGRRMKASGSEWIFNEPDFTGGLSISLTMIPGTQLAAIVDGGNDVHSVRLVDTSLIAGGTTPVVAAVKLDPGVLANAGIAFVAPDLLLVATYSGVVQALTLDTKARTLALDPKRTLTLAKLPAGDPTKPPVDNQIAGVAVTPDGKHAVVTSVTDSHVQIFDIDPTSTTVGMSIGSVDIGAAETFGAYFDPNDPTGAHIYVTIWGGRAVADIDLTNIKSPTMANHYVVDKDPAGIAFLDARWMVAGNGLGDTISLIDRTSKTVTAVQVEPDVTLHGYEPTMLAYDSNAKRLYATLAGINAIGAYDVDLSMDPPTLTFAGKMPTSWWPGGVKVRDDGALIIASMRGHGSGPTEDHWDVGDGEIGDRMRGGVQLITSPSSADLSAGQTFVQTSSDVGHLAGAPAITCPQGVKDFPIPATNTEGPSTQITHVIFILRENKDFDGIFGDFPNVEGDKTLTFKGTSAEMDSIWTNARTLARTFAMSDNYYTDAVFSTQGHVWATYGRADDFDERTWAVSGSGEPREIPMGGVVDVGQPAEGSLFDWLISNHVETDILGEGVGSPSAKQASHFASDIKYPGGPIQNIDYPDLEKTCYTVGRQRVACSLSSFVYMTVTNDHTEGVSPSNPTPEVMCAVNDEATGMLVDGVSHSPDWPHTLIVVTEDDPSQGGEHIDEHRAPLLMISPWVKHGYVSKTHTDVASLHKLFAHIFGLPYPNLDVQNAGLALDAFTSTPDFTPYTYTPRSIPLACGGGGSLAEQELTSSWDFHDVDDQPGLDAQVTRWMRGAQKTKLSVREKREIAARRAKLGMPSGTAARDDDDLENHFFVALDAGVADASQTSVLRSILPSSSWS